MIYMMMKKCSIAGLFLLLCSTVAAQLDIYVSPTGNDASMATSEKPLASFEGAQRFIQRLKPKQDIRVIFKDGIYYLPRTIQFSSSDALSNGHSITYTAAHEGKAIISGGLRIKANWQPFQNGIYVAQLSTADKIDQLYINGERQEMARYPNSRKNKNVFDTWDLVHKPIFDSLQDVFLPSRVASWKNPEGGYIHAMHAYLWGDMHWLITQRRTADQLSLEGGWQNNRPSPMHPVFRMAENIFEELDNPGEWYFDQQQNKLFYYPHPHTNLETAVVEIVRLKHLVEFNGSQTDPVKNIHLKGFVFRHTARTFMENKEPLLRSDWTLYRGAAIIYQGAENCEIRDCEFDQLGGNTILVSKYNRKITIKGCYIHNSGASGIVFSGDTKAVRNPLYGYQAQQYEKLDTTRGSASDDYPSDCLVEDCLITMTGRVEKQTAPIQISVAFRIRVNHCSIYDVPRAGINISEGAFGGHIIENSDIFNTVLETGDHGSFNSWGRDRYWSPSYQAVHPQVAKNPSLPFLDILEPTILRNNRWRCDHGWDIDLDDGSSRYRIYNNLLLKGGLKLREGYDRIVTNNIVVNNSIHPHVWYKESGDMIQNNIFFGRYYQIMMDNTVGPNQKWGKSIDLNFFVTDSAQMKAFIKNGADSNSLSGDPLFVDPASGDFRVKDSSPAKQIGFINFDMQSFGVRKPALKRIAKTPIIPILKNIASGDLVLAPKQYKWMDVLLSEPKGEALSAYGAGFGETGVALGIVPEKSPAHQLGFRSGDFILSIDGKKVEDIINFKKIINDLNKAMTPHVLLIIRTQKSQELKLQGNLPSIVDLK